MRYLKQSTVATVMIGPFVDETNGFTAETGLTITQADVRLSKNGANMAQKNDATGCTHDEIGWYTCPLNATDTDTLGRLILMVHESGARPIYVELMVVKANWFDTMCSTDYLQAHAREMDADLINANAIATNAIDSDALSASAIDEIWDENMEGTHTAREMIRLFAAVLVAKVSGGGGVTITFRDIDDSKNRVVATVDSDGNRTNMVLTET